MTYPGAKTGQSLRTLRDELLALSRNTVIITTQAERMLVIADIRKIEIDLDGEPSTPWPGTHHE